MREPAPESDREPRDLGDAVLRFTLLGAGAFGVVLGASFVGICNQVTSYSGSDCAAPSVDVDGATLLLVGLLMIFAALYGGWRAGLSTVRLTAIAGLAIAAILVLPALSLVPVARSFEIRGAAYYDLQTTCSGVDALPGTAITFHWSDGSAVEFGVWSCNGNSEAYQANGTGGFGAIVAQGGAYSFGAICVMTCHPANVSGNYTAPWIAL